VDALIETFWEISRDAQRVAVGYLARESGERHIPFFTDMLSRNGIDALVIKGALAFLGQKMRCVSRGPQLLALLRHEDDGVKEAALEACIALHDPAVDAALAGMYKERDPLMRMMAVYAMGHSGDPGPVPALQEALEDETPDIRKIALEALAKDRDQLLDRLPLLSRRLGDENREVRLAFIDVLVNCPLDKVTDLLFHALDDQDDWVRIRVVDAFARWRLAAAVPRLVQMLEHSNLMVTLKIIEALGAIGDTVSFRTLLGQMGHDEPEVQQAAAEAIARIREEQGGGL
jgi:HEAT repeat protein